MTSDFPLSDPNAAGNVWTVFYPARPGGSDVAVPSAKDKDMAEWRLALNDAVKNARYLADEATRWSGIVQELALAVADMKAE